MRKREPRVQFDLPAHHLPEVGPHAVPDKARDPNEIAFRKELRLGGVVLGQQVRGTSVAANISEGLASQDVDDGGYTADMLAMAGFNTASYNNERFKEEAMTRRSKLARLVTDEGTEDEYRATKSGLYVRANQGMRASLKNAHELAIAYEAGTEGEATYLSLTRSLANTSAILSAVGVLDDRHFAALSEVDAQEAVKKRVLKMMERARTIATTPYEEYGSEPMHKHPSMMQLAERDSALSVHIRRFAPNSTRYLLEKAQSEVIV